VRPAVAVVAASLATELVLLPASAMLFGRVTIAGPIVNLAAVPAMAVVQQAGMTVVACHAWWPAVADVAGRVVIAAAWVLVRSADLLDWAPALASRVPAPSWVAVGAYAMAGFIALGAASWHRLPGPWRWRARLAGTFAASATAVWILAHPWTWRTPWSADGRLHLTGIDVGQGDATLVRLPDATTLLVDTGGLGGQSSFDIGAGDLDARRRPSRRAAADARRPGPHRRRGDDHRRLPSVLNLGGHRRAVARADGAAARAGTRARAVVADAGRRRRLGTRRSAPARLESRGP
jgi:competence protein ComEC